MVSLFGVICVSRAYYYCRHCHDGIVPWDDTLGLGKRELTPGAWQVISLLGIQRGFEEASDRLLPIATGMRLSESTVRRATEDAGRQVRRRQEAGESPEPVPSWGWHRDAEEKTCAYVTIDATGVPQQARGGGKAEGRMAWVGAVYNPLPEKVAWRHPDTGPRPQMQARYVSGMGTLESFGPILRHEAAAVGMDEAERWIAISDAGSGLEDFLRDNFGRVEAVILDFFHAAERLHELAKALSPTDSKQSEQQASEWCHRLKHEGGRAMLETLRQLPLPRGRGSASAQACYQEQLTYFENQVDRMDYPTYIAKGWQIGSGPVESACKRVVNQRLKCAGMRWREPGSDEVCRLRALYLSTDHQWETFWQRPRAA